MPRKSIEGFSRFRPRASMVNSVWAARSWRNGSTKRRGKASRRRSSSTPGARAFIRRSPRSRRPPGIAKPRNGTFGKLFPSRPVSPAIESSPIRCCRRAGRRSFHNWPTRGKARAPTPPGPTRAARFSRLRETRRARSVGARTRRTPSRPGDDNVEQASRECLEPLGPLRGSDGSLSGDPPARTPCYLGALTNLGAVHERQGNADEGIRAYRERHPMRPRLRECLSESGSGARAKRRPATSSGSSEESETPLAGRSRARLRHRGAREPYALIIFGSRCLRRTTSRIQRRKSCK